MKYSVPFIPDSTYTSFLLNHKDHLSSVYFSLQTGPVLDARMRFSESGDSLLKNSLSKFSAKKYCLLNSRFIHPDQYHDVNFLDQLLDRLTILKDSGNLDGIVFSDTYLLSALSTRKHFLIGQLEAVPGINCMIDSYSKAMAYFEIIEQAGFLKPGKIILDRALNRDLEALKKISQVLKTSYADIKIELLANEGCILHCPYKLAHDSQISFSNLGISTNSTFRINQDIGCHNYFFRQPDRFLKSPFIRPEDVDDYRSCVDTIKLCGRTIGPTFLMRCLTAYFQKSYDGNLLDLMDASFWLSDHYLIQNKRLDPDFLKMVTKCTKDCKNCRICLTLWNRAANKKSFEFKDYKDFQ